MTKPTEQARAYHIRGTKPASRERKQLAALTPSQREVITGGRYEVHCVRCLGPRDRRSHPVCDACSPGRLA